MCQSQRSHTQCACQVSWWSVEKWRRYYILKFHGNTFRWLMTLTFDLKFWKYVSVTEKSYSMCMSSFMMIGWEMTEILHIEILRKHGHTNMGITIPRPPPMGGRGNDAAARWRIGKLSGVEFYHLCWWEPNRTSMTRLFISQWWDFV